MAVRAILLQAAIRGRLLAITSGNENIDTPPDFTAPAGGVVEWYLGPLAADRPGGPLIEGLEIAFAGCESKSAKKSAVLATAAVK